ncbi:hypothetical protein KW452_06030 [Vibrio fluvialis]|nr:hypothetical protein [Vibrio fluvialis]
MKDNLSNYLRAVSLKRNMEKEYSEINSDILFFDNKFFDNFRLALIDLVNFRDAKDQWNILLIGTPLIEKSKLFNKKRKDIENFRNNFSGHYDADVLNTVYRKYNEAFLTDSGSESQYIMITFRMLQESINSRNGELKSMFFWDGNIECDLFCPEHQAILIKYLNETLLDAIKVCEFVAQKLVEDLQIPDGRTAMAALIAEMEKAQNEDL